MCGQTDAGGVHVRQHLSFTAVFWEGPHRKCQGQNRTGESPLSGIVGGLAETRAMGRAKRARTAETPKQPSPCLMLRALHFYPDLENRFSLGAHAVIEAEGKTGGRANASAQPTWRGLRPWHVRKLLAREPGDLQLDRRCPYGLAARIGKARSRSR